MAKGQKPLYIGTSGLVAALDPLTGEELWRTKLPKAGVGSPVSILLKDQCLYVGSYGRAYCLDGRTGEVLWQNGLPKMGYHAVLLAMDGAQGGTSPEAVVAEVHRQQQAAAASAGGAGAGAAM